MQVPKRRSEQYIKHETGPFLITAGAFERLKKDLEGLQKNLPALIAEVEHAKSYGDFSENAAYQHAKQMLRQTYGRITVLNNRLKRAVLIKQDDNNSDTVLIGSIVTVETNGKQSTFEILGSHESDPSHGRISNVSPLGQALLNHAVGDQVILNLKNSQITYRILSIQ